MRLYYFLRCAHPAFFYSITILITLVLVVPIVLSDFVTERVGGQNLSYKVKSFKKAIKWQWKATIIGDSKQSPQAPVRMYGNILDAHSNGLIEIEVADGKEFKKINVFMANIVIKNFSGIKKMVQSQSKNDAVIDFYGDQIVVWIERKPFNLELINAGYATPLDNPPTNIVELMYARYFWKESGLFQ